MKQSTKKIWKVIGIFFPYVFIVVSACIAYFQIKDYYFSYRLTTDYYAYICYVVVACTALLLVWVTWLYRRIKKKLDLLLEEKEERLFVLRHQARSASEQNAPATNAPADHE